MNRFVDKDYSESKKGIWKKIFSLLLEEKKLFIEMLIAVLVVALCDCLVPLFNSYAIDRFFKDSNNLGDARFNNVYLYLILYALISLSTLIALYFHVGNAGKLDARTVYKIRKKAFRKLQELPFSYYDVTSQGWIMARLTSDARKLSNIISWGLVDFLWGILNMIGILIILFIKNVYLACIILVILVLMLTIANIIKIRVLKAFREARKVNSEVTAGLNESLIGNKTTKNLVIEKQNEEEFNNLAFKLKKKTLRAVLISSLMGPIMFLLGYIAVSLTLFEGGKMYINNNAITIGTLYLFVDYSIKFFEPVSNITNLLTEFQQAQAAAERVVGLIEEEPQISDTPDVILKYGDSFNKKKENYEKIEGMVEFRDVSFKYNTGDYILKDFNLKINKGDKVALVGPTGAGKSTIVNLICRFYEPTDGKILIDNVDYKERSVGWLHSNLGYVLQTPQLFSGTILDNIKYGNLDATMDDCIKAAKMVDIYDFIMSLDDKFDTYVGEGGSRLSVGERQLISFARAIIANPSLFVLDEATSSVDTESELKIQSAINNVLENRTSFIIAHRLSTIISSDKILYIKDGKIMEMGTHKELLDKKGYYYELYRAQFLKENEQKL